MLLEEARGAQFIQQFLIEQQTAPNVNNINNVRPNDNELDKTTDDHPMITSGIIFVLSSRGELTSSYTKKSYMLY